MFLFIEPIEEKEKAGFSQPLSFFIYS